MEHDIENEDERLRRWRLMLGSGVNCKMSRRDGKMDGVLTALYGHGGKTNKDGGQRRGGSEASMPNVSRWLGDIRKYFPVSVVQVMQQDAIEKIGLRNLLTQKEILEQIEPDVSLVATLLTLKDVIPGETKDTARILVRKVVDDLIKRLESPMRQAIRGAINRSQRNRRPRHQEIDWNRTIRLNLKHYQQDYKTVIPETLIGFGRKKNSTHDVIICIDQSGSMASSLVYASVFGAVMASIPALRTHMIVFDTAVVDLTEHLHDPVDVLFGAALGGGTDINQALGYCQTLVSRPEDTTLVLITDLYEGGDRSSMLNRAAQLVNSGVQLVTLLALSDHGAPGFDHNTAADMVNQGAAAFACTPDLFPELMAATMNRKDLNYWAEQHQVKLVRAHQSTS